MDEEEFRGVGNVTVPFDENLAEDWDTLRGLPRYIYLVYKGYGCDTMELWRLHCLGQQRAKRYAGVDDQWLYRYDRPSPRRSPASRRNGRNMSSGRTLR